MPTYSDDDLRFMQMALDEARAALKSDDVPVGAVLVRSGEVLGRGYNQREELSDPSAHAEVQALRAAAQKEKDWNLNGSTLYITLEPCAMCAGAIVSARVKEIVYAAVDPKGGALSLQLDLLDNERLNHRVKIRRGPLEKECGDLLKSFFQDKRKKSP